MAASRLPPEMISTIMDKLRDDKPTLKACSLVCKAWAHPARIQLFFRLTIKWPLQSAIFPFVRHLCIPVVVGLRYDGPTLDQLIPLLCGFHRITLLEVDLLGRSLNSIKARTWSALGKTFSGVPSLSLISFHNTDATSLAQVICAFSCLRELSIRGSHLMYSEPHALMSSETFRPSPHLHTLELDVVNVTGVLEWLLSLPSRPTLRTARLYYSEVSDIAIYDKFIGTFGNDLETLSFSNFMPDWTHCSIDVTPLTRLRLIEFHIPCGRRLDATRNRWVTQVLSDIPSAQLQSVEFKLEFFSAAGEPTSGDVSHALEWHDADAALQRPTFSSLKNVHLSSISYATDKPLFLPEDATQLLPRTHVRRIVSVNQWE